ncbi:MAG: glutathione S-transferase family protein [Tepidamorphaceae bacterium]|nr:glutathione S-transferase family protein [Rhodobiaceae bacterium]MCC0049859.1 glutathione S-transferase family protein [Rhodobiaceae bacterium]
MLKLYYGPRTIAVATLIALEEAGAEYEPVRLDMANLQQRTPEYLAINPKGRVPALVTDRGILTETPATLAYIAQTHPDAKLAPFDDPFAFAEVQSFCAYLCSTVHVAHAHKMRGTRWVKESDKAALKAMKANVPNTMSACFSMIEEEMFKGPWVMGSQFTICDPYLFAIASWLEADGVDVTPFPLVMEHRSRMHERDSVKRVMAMQNA